MRTYFDKEQLWNNIKNCGVFNSYEEFLEKSNDYPGCFVWRKYPSEPWIKDNIFIGSHEELLTWYKTNTEVPFFYSKFKNKKYKSLLIKDFYVNFVNGKRVIFAQCICDCGNECCKAFEGIRKGNTGTCGCRGKKQEQSLIEAYPEMVEKYWDFKKNCDEPNSIKYNSDTKYLWKGYNTSFLMSPNELLKNLNNSTSFPEQSIVFFLKQHFNNVESRTKILYNNKKYELDIYMPEFKIGIEYDGERWHKDKYEQEIEKNNAANANGIYLIRVRESGLKIIKSKNVKNIVCDIENYTYYEAIANCINEIFDFLKAKLNLSNFHNITKHNIIQSKIQIMSQYMLNFKEDSIELSWLNQFWSDSNQIEAYKVSQNSSDRFDFKCHNGEKINIPPYVINNVLNRLKDEQQNEFKEKLLYKGITGDDYCPFVDLPYCPCNRIYHNEDCKPCQFFDNYKNNTIYTVPFKETEKTFNAAFKKVAEDIDSSTNKYHFRTALINLLMYKIGNRDRVINKFCKSDIISDNQKIVLLDNCIFWPEFEYLTTKRLFENSLLLQLYFINYDYSKILFTDESILDLFHEYVIYDILKSFVLMKDFDLLEKALNIIKLNVKTDLFINIVYALVLQIVLKSGEKFNKLFDRKQGFVSFYNLINNLFNNKIPLQIKKIFENFLGKDDISEVQYKVQCVYFGNLIDELILNNSLSNEHLLKIALKFQTTTLNFSKTTRFSQFIKLKILKYKKSIPSELIKPLNSLADIQNSYNDYLDRCNSMIPHKNWVIDLSDIKDLRLLKTLIQQDLLFKFDYELVIKKKKYDIFEKFIYLINTQEIWVNDFIEDKDNIAQLLKKTKRQDLMSFAEDISTNYILGRKK